VIADDLLANWKDNRAYCMLILVTRLYTVIKNPLRRYTEHHVMSCSSPDTEACRISRTPPHPASEIQLVNSFLTLYIIPKLGVNLELYFSHMLPTVSSIHSIISHAKPIKDLMKRKGAPMMLNASRAVSSTYHSAMMAYRIKPILPST